MERLYIGKIVGTHGLKGEVKIKSLSSFSKERFSKGKKVTLSKDGQEYEMECITHRQHKGMELVAFKGYQDINLVEKFRDFKVYGEYDPTLLAENEYFYADVIGCEVYDQHDQKIGVIQSIMENPRYDILVVDRPGEKRMLIPYIDAFILEENIAERRIKVNVLEGL